MSRDQPPPPNVATTLTPRVCKGHNRLLLIYHAVCAAKYRRAISEETADVGMREVCLDNAHRYEKGSLGVAPKKTTGTSWCSRCPPTDPLTMRTIASVTAREVFSRLPQVRV